MLIDYLTGRFCFSDGNLILTLLFYTLAAAVALTLRYLGQARCRKKNGVATPIHHTILDEGAAFVWNILFFLVTGCLKGAVQECYRTENRTVNRKIFFAQFRFILYGGAGSFFLYTVFQLFASLVGGGVWQILLLAAKALTCAHISLLVSTLLPLPCSDADVYLRKGELSKRGIAFRRNGVWPFFVFCILGLVLACTVIPVGGREFSLSSLLTLFPIFLIGG